MWLSFSCILKFPLFPPSLHNTCSCYYLHSQIDANKDSVFWLVNLHPSSIQVERKIGCISIPSKSVQVFLFKFLVWYTRSKNLNSRNLNGDLDAKLVSCIPGFRYIRIEINHGSQNVFLSFNMDWRILVNFIPRLWLGIKY
jgi:hypothetical protein